MSAGAGPGLSTFPYGFSGGVSIRGIPFSQTHTGKAFWLYNGPFVAPQGRAGADGNDGSFNSPFATLQGALNKVTPGRGDIIFVKPGHAENISSATALVVSVSNVAIIGLGQGVLRPTFTLNTAATATINITADDVTFQNCIFKANFLNIAACFTLGVVSGTVVLNNGTATVTSISGGSLNQGMRLVATGIPANTVITSQVSGTAGGNGVYTVSTTTSVASVSFTTTARGFNLDNCDLLDTSSVLNFLVGVVTSTQSNAHDFLSITRNRFVFLATSGVVNLLSYLGSNAEVTITDNYYQSASTNASAIIPFAAGTTVTCLQLLRNTLISTNATGTATGIVITSNSAGSTGMIDQNSIHSLANTTLASSLLVTTGTGIWFGTNRFARTADKSAVTSLPALDT